MRFVAFLAGLVLFIAPVAYLTFVWMFFDQIARDNTWHEMGNVMVANRWLGLPIWASCLGCAALGAWLLYVGQHRPPEPVVRRQGTRTHREPIIRQLAR